MFRHILHDLEWGITLAIITLILFLIIANLTIKPAIAAISETDLAPGQVYCRSERVLTDTAGHKWQVMLFAHTSSPQVASLNLRLSGLSGSDRIQTRKPLVIVIPDDRSEEVTTLRYKATNLFLEEPPLPSIGQYDFKNILSQLPTRELLLEIPLENGTTSLQIPKAIIKEWHEVAAKNLGRPTKLPSGFQLAC